ncbi:leucine-rich repeat protein [Paenibacillus sp. EPM92]|uniref:leucine-rich repeat protein n=1 Tax=Paenibacillus sp. EPM92 TaxID=1561195 RepID=UPI0019153DAF|nr:leucine-rich repeat protein [Paenibacillus sp. EPM92]
MNVRKRKFFSGIALSLVICLLVSLFPLGGLAVGASVTDAVYSDFTVTSAVYDSDPGDFTYVMSDRDSGSIEITGYTGAGGNIVIPDSIDEYPVYAIRSSWDSSISDYVGAFQANQDIISVEIPEGVRVIEPNSFKDNHNLTTVKLPSSVGEISTGTFENNTSLKEVTLPSNLLVISDKAFRGCTSLSSISLPDTLREIYDFAFEDSGLSTISFPSSLDYIGNGAFSFNRNLETVVIPENVQQVVSGAFSYDYGLRSISFEGTNTAIGGSADDLNTIPYQATIVGHIGSTAEEYATKNNIPFRDISNPGFIEPDNGDQDPLSRFHRGEDVVVANLFEDPVLAEYFVQWMSESLPTFPMETIVWSGTVNDTINKRDVEKRMELYFASFGVFSFGDPDYKGFTSLEGLQIFKDSILSNPNYSSNAAFYLNGNELTDVDALSFLSEVNLLDLSDNQLSNIDGLNGLTRVAHLNLSNNQLTDLDGLSNLTTIIEPESNLNPDSVLDFSRNELNNILGLSNLTMTEFINGKLIDFRNNDLTNSSVISLRSLFGVMNPNGRLLFDYNFLNLRSDSEGIQFYNDWLDASGLASGDPQAKTPQYRYRFDRVDTLKVEHRETGTDTVLDSEIYSTADNSLQIDDVTVYESKEINGYSLIGDPTQMIKNKDYVYTSELVPMLNLIDSSSGQSLGVEEPSDSTTYTVSDESILDYDDTDGKLYVVGDGNVTLSIAQNGVAQGSFPLTFDYHGSKDHPVVFYYQSTAPANTHTMTILNPLGQGSVFPTVGTHEYPSGETVSLSTNNSVPGYEFEKWVIDGEDVYYPNPFALWVDVVMDRNHVAQAVFKSTSPAQFTLSVNQIGEGLVSPTGVTNHFPLEPVTLTASPAAGHRFIKWVVNGVESFTPVMTITMNNNTTATAYFEPLIQYTLSVDHVGEGDVSPARVSNFYEFQTVNLTANPADGYKFVKWVVNGEEILTANITITMDRDITAVAYFDLITPTAPNQFILTVNQIGEGATTPSSDNEELKYDKDGEVTLKADPAEGYVFVKWIVDGQDYTEAKITIKMDKNKTATAYFEPVTPPPVTKGELTVEFRDSVTNEKIRDDEVLTDLELGEHSYIADAVIGVYELVGEALKKVVLTVAEPFQKITFSYKAKVITSPADEEDDPVEPPVINPPVEDDPVEQPVVQEPPTSSVVEEPADPPVVEVPAEPPVVEQSEEPIGNEKPVFEDPNSDQPVENEPVIIQEPVSDADSSEDIPVSNDVSIVEKAPELDQVRIVTIDVETDEVLTEEILRDLPLGKHGISAPAIEGYESLDPSIQSVTVEAQGRQLVVEFRYQKLKQYGTVFGVVLDKDGNPMKGIQVELHSDPRVTYTNANGEYKFENAELGQHTVILKNPFTNEELGKVEIVVYQDSEQKNSRTESLKDASEIRTVIELNESENTRRIDFIIEPVEPKDFIPQIPQEPEPIEPKSKLPIIPIAATPILIIAVIIYFRRKNVVIYDISDKHANNGFILRKLRVKAKQETTIDLYGLEVSHVRIQFKNPAAFQNVDLFLQHGDNKRSVSLQDDQAYFDFDLTVLKD